MLPNPLAATLPPSRAQLGPETIKGSHWPPSISFSLHLSPERCSQLTVLLLALENHGLITMDKDLIVKDTV